MRSTIENKNKVLTGRQSYHDYGSVLGFYYGDYIKDNEKRQTFLASWTCSIYILYI